MSIVYNNTVVTSGLVTCIDSSNPRSYPGTGTAVYDIANTLPLSTTGLTVSSGAFVFNGTTSSITASSTMFNRIAGDSMTVSCWMKPGRLAGQYQDLVVNRSDGLYNWMLFQHTTDGSIQLHGSAQYKSSYIPTIGVWINVAATVDSAGNYNLYVNGVVQQTVVGYSYANMAPSSLCIGKFGTAAEYYLGSMGNIAIYNRALSAAEVTQNFNALRGGYGI